MVSRLLCATAAATLAACSEPGFGRDASGDAGRETSSDAADSGDSDAHDAATAELGACLFEDDPGDVTCSERTRDQCPLQFDGSYVFYGEGSTCDPDDYGWSQGDGDCDTDVDGDGLTNGSDISATVDCQFDWTREGCEQADVNSDGVVDEWDRCAVSAAAADADDPCGTPACGACRNTMVHGLCSIDASDTCTGTLGGAFHGALTRCPECAWDGDVDGDGTVDFQDVGIPIACADHVAGAQHCDRADVNCDGYVNDCDQAAATCLLETANTSTAAALRCRVRCSPSP